MDRPKGLEQNRYVGDKRTQVVYDLDDDATPEDAVADIVAAESFLTFGPDTVTEARNRGYKPWKGYRTTS